MSTRSDLSFLSAREAEIARIDLSLTDRKHASVFYRMVTWLVAWRLRRRRAQLEVEVAILRACHTRHGRLEFNRRGR